MKSQAYLYGKNPLEEAINATVRDGVIRIETLKLTKSAALDKDIMSLVQKAKLSYDTVTNAEIESVVGKDAVHQGVFATLIEKNLYTSYEEMMHRIVDKDRPLLVLLDELQDPHNVGAIIRSAACFGADAVLIPEYNQTGLTGTVIKSSAGNAFHIPIVRIGNVSTVILKLQEKRFWVYGLTGQGDTSLPAASFDSPTVIVVGSEGAGLHAKVLEHCDFKLSIPMSSTTESLNASNAVAVALYEWRRQAI